MEIYKIVIPFVIVFILSCNNNLPTSFNFEHKALLTGDVLPAQELVYLRYPFRIRKMDSIIYLLDLHGQDYFVHSFIYPNIKYKKSYAPRGNGPNDFMGVENIRINELGDMLILDANKEIIRTIHFISDSIINDINLNKDLARCLDFAIINDSTFAIPDYTGEYRVQIIDNRGKIKKRLFKIPSRERRHEKVSGLVLAQAWRSFIDYNPNNGILALATQLGQVIEVYNLKEEKEISILYGKDGEPKFLSKGAYAIPNGIMGYSDVHVGMSKIYTIFWGHTFKEIQNNLQVRMDGGDILQVFGIDGVPLKQYKLDRKITGFHIDEENNKLIGLDVNSDYQIVEYDL